MHILEYFYSSTSLTTHIKRSPNTASHNTQLYNSQHASHQAENQYQYLYLYLYLYSHSRAPVWRE